MQQIRSARHVSLTLRCLWLVLSVSLELPESASRFLPLYARFGLGLRKFPKPGQALAELVFRSHNRRVRKRIGKIAVPHL